jgi:hypothetical protein
MLSFEESVLCHAPVEELWALLYDPTRFPEWWVGTERTETIPDGANLYTEADPQMVFPTRIMASPGHERVTISCLTTDIAWQWTLEAAPEGCRLQLSMQIPDHQAHLLELERDIMQASLHRLVALAERTAAGSPWSKGLSESSGRRSAN